MSPLGLYASQYLGVPYRWGGNTWDGMDCSGFILKVLNDFGMALPDMTAESLYKKYRNKWYHVEPELQDSIIFFGQDASRISHVALSLGDGLIIHASGGNSSTQTLRDALDRDARVKVESLYLRRDYYDALWTDFESFRRRRDGELKARIHRTNR